MMVSETVLIALISGVGGIVTAYITNVLAKKVNEKKAQNQPKDRMEQMFDGYERLIAQKDLEDQRKAAIIRELQYDIQKVEKELHETKRKLQANEEELIASREKQAESKRMFDEMREEYRRFKAEMIEKQTKK